MNNMNNTKTLLQRVQSRISKRRNYISGLDEAIKKHYFLEGFYGSGTFTKGALAGVKAVIKEEGESQQLDKKLFQALLGIERNKHEWHFRSKYGHYVVDGPLEAWCSVDGSKW